LVSAYRLRAALRRRKPVRLDTDEAWRDVAMTVLGVSGDLEASRDKIRRLLEDRGILEAAASPPTEPS
jgi:hypothetical protein